MSLDLDERQRAMLHEMGLPLLPPAAPVPSATSAVPALAAAVAEPAPQARTATPAASPAAHQVIVPVAAPAPRASVAEPLPTGDRPAGVEALDWDGLHAAISGCRACGLCESRRNVVPGVGPQRAEVMVIGEAPGEQEDLHGEPFVGPAGQLLDAMLRSVGMDRQRNVYIANVLKCRPPGNRNPQPQEMAQCEPFLRRQIALVQPRLILAMGRFALQALLRTTEPVGKLRGRVHQYEGVPVVVTYHPAYLLRNLADKARAWSDLCLALEVMDGRLPPGVQSGSSGM